MKVFISWSGEQSKHIARALRGWLPMVIQAAKEPYMSDDDNDAGERWSHVLSEELEASSFGIVCLTPSNLHSDWILFEAGALGKLVSSRTRVVSLLHNLTQNDVGLPLSQFMMKPLDESGVFDTVKSMNNVLDEDDRLKDAELARLFRNCWPDLKAELDAVPLGEEPKKRDDRELLEEILELVRGAIGFSNFTPSASGPGEFYIEGGRLRGLDVGVPPKIIERMRRIAGPNGLIMTDSLAITIQSPRVGADDFTIEEQMFLDTTRNFLEAMGIKLKYLDRPEMRPES